MLRNLASALILTERDAEFDPNPPKVKGRVVTTVSKAKEVRPLVEKCVTIAKKSLAAEDRAREFDTSADRGSESWSAWRQSDEWQEWNRAIAPAVAARRRCLKLLGDKQAVRVLFDDIAPRFIDRPGGYTRIVRLAAPRLGDAGPQAVLEFVGVRDRVVVRSERPAFDETDDDSIADAEQDAGQPAADQDAPQDTAADEDAPQDAGPTEQEEKSS